MTERALADATGWAVKGHYVSRLTIISDVTQAANNAWYGKIVDPRDGATCSAQLWVDSDWLLDLRGYVGIPLHLIENCRFG